MSSFQQSNSPVEKNDDVRADVLHVGGTKDIYAEGSLDPVYHAKAKILNDALQEIGMGKYQWCLFFVAGFGWFSICPSISPISANGALYLVGSRPAYRELALIGLAFPLYNAFVTYYLETRGAAVGTTSLYITYRNQVILSVIGVPGALMAGYLVELPILGRRGTLSIFTILTGVFILSSTTARTSNSYLAWNCGYSYTSNVMYGVLYALSPELFPTKDRGTGNSIVAAANRIFGVMAPIIALYANITTSIPIWVSGGIFVSAGLIALLLPFEPRGKASL
ncbi:hypothetical protein ID866_6109 [Astraeus odoratus]|nr:hypothetical protein ID866_6109 [Astraeus odoratus]